MKTGIELLAENPKALARFCELLAERATVCGLENEILKEADSLRVQLAAARAINFSPENLLNFCCEKTHPRLTMTAAAIGRERGQRLGREAGQNSILEARNFAKARTAIIAPWLVEAVTEDDGE